MSFKLAATSRYGVRSSRREVWYAKNIQGVLCQVILDHVPDILRSLPFITRRTEYLVISGN